MCAALSLLSQPATTKLPPIEALFTVDEETGLTGASQLDAYMLTGEPVWSSVMVCSLSLLEPAERVSHQQAGLIEAPLTTNEETGLTGTSQLDTSTLTGGPVCNPIMVCSLSLLSQSANTMLVPSLP